jgi:hypothetical protein
MASTKVVEVHARKAPWRLNLVKAARKEWNAS